MVRGDVLCNTRFVPNVVPTVAFSSLKMQFKVAKRLVGWLKKSIGTCTQCVFEIHQKKMILSPRHMTLMMNSNI